MVVIKLGLGLLTASAFLAVTKWQSPYYPWAPYIVVPAYYPTTTTTAAPTTAAPTTVKPTTAAPTTTARPHPYPYPYPLPYPIPYPGYALHHHYPTTTAATTTTAAPSNYPYPLPYPLPYPIPYPGYALHHHYPTTTTSTTTATPPKYPHPNLVPVPYPVHICPRPFTTTSTTTATYAYKQPYMPPGYGYTPAPKGSYYAITASSVGKPYYNKNNLKDLLHADTKDKPVTVLHPSASPKVKALNRQMHQRRKHLATAV